MGDDVPLTPRRLAQIADKVYREMRLFNEMMTILEHGINMHVLMWGDPPEIYLNMKRRHAAGETMVMVSAWERDG